MAGAVIFDITTKQAILSKTGDAISSASCRRDGIDLIPLYRRFSFESSRSSSGYLPHPLGIRIRNLIAEIHVALFLKRNKMDMGMRHFKAEHCHTDLPTRYCCAKSFSHSLCKHHHASESGIVDVKYVVGLLLGHYKSMTPVDWIYIEKSEKLIILCHLIAGNIAPDDFGEYGHGSDFYLYYLEIDYSGRCLHLYHITHFVAEKALGYGGVGCYLVLAKISFILCDDGI